MIEVNPNLFVGDEEDSIAAQHAGKLFVIHAAKEPYHRRALGYTTHAAPKDHPEYLIAARPGELMLNLIDSPDVSQISRECIEAAVRAIADHIDQGVLIHCNKGVSRSPAIALLYMLGVPRSLGIFGDISGAIYNFSKLYPDFDPGMGMSDFLYLYWRDFLPANDGLLA